MFHLMINFDNNAKNNNKNLNHINDNNDNFNDIHDIQIRDFFLHLTSVFIINLIVVF